MSFTDPLSGGPNTNVMVSVIICCYNSSSKIRKVLLHLSQQVVPDAWDWEVVIVDNACDDETSKLAEEYWKEFHINTLLRVVHEGQPGLAHARKAGMTNTDSKYVIFCDDDNLLDRDYLYNVVDLMESDPTIGAVGGSSTAVFEQDALVPHWFNSSADNYAVGRQYPESTHLGCNNLLWGAGLGIRAEPVRNIYRMGVQSLLPGRSGGKWLAGDDSELCCWIKAAGYGLYYSDSLHFCHFMSSDRLTIKRRNSILKGIKKSSDLISTYLILLSADCYRNNTKSLHSDSGFLTRARTYINLIMYGSRVGKNIRIIKSGAPK